MSRTRLELHEKLKEVCDNVYFQAPRKDRMEYPCIMYEVGRPSTRHANNKVYKLDKRYSITYITKNPDDPVIDELLYFLPHMSWDRQYKSDNLYHNVYELYF